MKFLKLVLPAVGLAIFTSAHAATIVWSAVKSIAGDTDVSTNGTSVRAFNFGSTLAPLPATSVGGASTVAVNGVSFVAGASYTVANGLIHTFNSNPQNAPYASNATPFSSLSANYQNLLGNGIYSSDTAVQSLTLTQLVANSTYEVQIWLDDSRGGGTGARSATLTGGAGTVTLNYGGAAVGSLGQYVTGTFVADGTGTQIISFTPFGAVPSAQINALQLRLIPEPASAMLAAAGLGLLPLRRQRRG